MSYVDFKSYIRGDNGIVFVNDRNVQRFLRKIKNAPLNAYCSNGYWSDWDMDPNDPTLVDWMVMFEGHPLEDKLAAMSLWLHWRDCADDLAGYRPKPRNPTFELRSVK